MIWILILKEFLKKGPINFRNRELNFLENSGWKKFKGSWHMTGVDLKLSPGSSLRDMHFWFRGISYENKNKCLWIGSFGWWKGKTILFWANICFYFSISRKRKVIEFFVYLLNNEMASSITCCFMYFKI